MTVFKHCTISSDLRSVPNKLTDPIVPLLTTVYNNNNNNNNNNNYYYYYYTLSSIVVLLGQSVYLELILNLN